MNGALAFTNHLERGLQNQILQDFNFVTVFSIVPAHRGQAFSRYLNQGCMVTDLFFNYNEKKWIQPFVICFTVSIFPWSVEITFDLSLETSDKKNKKQNKKHTKTCDISVAMGPIPVHYWF